MWKKSPERINCARSLILFRRKKSSLCSKSIYTDCREVNSWSNTSSFVIKTEMSSIFVQWTAHNTTTLKSYIVRNACKKNTATERLHTLIRRFLASIVHPDKRQVFPLMAEDISNQDGKRKQDCEINAAKRMLVKIRKEHPQLGLIIVGDGLYSKQPII